MTNPRRLEQGWWPPLAGLAGGICVAALAIRWIQANSHVDGMAGFSQFLLVVAAMVASGIVGVVLSIIRKTRQRGFILVGVAVGMFIGLVGSAVR